MDKVIKNISKGHLTLNTSAGKFSLPKGGTISLHYRTEIYTDKANWEVINLSGDGSDQKSGLTYRIKD